MAVCDNAAIMQFVQMCAAPLRHQVILHRGERGIKGRRQLLGGQGSGSPARARRPASDSSIVDVMYRESGHRVSRSCRGRDNAHDVSEESASSPVCEAFRRDRGKSVEAIHPSASYRTQRFPASPTTFRRNPTVPGAHKYTILRNKRRSFATQPPCGEPSTMSIHSASVANPSSSSRNSRSIPPLQAGWCGLADP